MSTPCRWRPWRRSAPARVAAAVVAWLAALVSGPPQAVAREVPRGIDPAYALSELVVTRWSKEDGLPTDVLLSVRQTSSGDLWAAGFGGLARFDGIDFEVFNQTTTPELAASSFYEVLEDGDGLWIATQAAGLWRLEDGRFARATSEPSTLSVRALRVDRDGELWVGAADKGAFRLRAGRLEAVDHPALAAASVRAILEDRRGDVWLGTEDRGLVRYSRGDVAPVGALHGVSSLCEARDGTIWIGTSKGLHHLRGGEVSARPELENVEIYSVHEDDYGSLWVAAEQGLFRRPPAAERFEHLETIEGHSLRSVNRVAFDHEGGAWVSSYTDGLFQLRIGQFINYTVADGLASRRVNSVYETRDGRILVGGDGGAVDVIAGGEVTRLALASLPDVRIRSFYEDRGGDLWISSYAGLLRVRGEREELLTTADGLPVDLVRLVFEDSAGRFWIATRGGGLVRRLPDGGFEAMGRDQGLPSDFVLSIDEDPAGRLLVGTQGGLAIYAPGGEPIVYSSENGLPGNLVFNTFVDGGGAIWIATTGGLARLADGQLRALTVRQGLPADAVYDYREDGLGYAWMSSGVGLVRVPKSEIDEVLAGRRAAIEPEVLDRGDGLAEPQCTGATRMEVGSDGRLWVPTLGGLSTIDPARVRANPVPPPVVIRRLLVDGERALPPPGGERPIVVPPGRRRFVFAFSALSFQAPERVEVRYRLDGFDDRWIDAGGERMAVYTGLPPGGFTFRVIAANDDGVWSEREATLALRVRPHFHQTPVFFLLVAALLLVGPWGFYRWRVASARRRNEELERLLAEQRRLERERVRLIGQLEERNEQLEHLTYAVSHDLKSPLYTIQGFLGLLVKDHESGDEERFRLDVLRIRQATEGMRRLLRGLLKIRRLEKVGARAEAVDLGEIARQAVDSVEGRLETRGITVEIADDLPGVVADPTEVLEILQNLVENAAFYMGEQPRPRIEIGWERREGETVVFVRDNGVGIEPEYQRKIFRLFERLETTVEGSGLGLAIVKRAVEAHGGRVWVESKGRGRGSTFRFTLGPASEAGLQSAQREVREE